MILNNTNTKFIFIYTYGNKGKERRFITDIMCSLKNLKDQNMNNDVLLLVDGITDNEILLECKEYDLPIPEIKTFSNDYAKQIEEINKENLVITITGHGSSNGDLTTKFASNVEPDFFYEPCKKNKNLKNIWFLWGQCYTGKKYKKLTDSNKKFYLFGASNQQCSISSCLFFYETFTLEGNYIYKNLFDKYLTEKRFFTNIFILLFFLGLKNLINRDIDDSDVTNFFNKISSNYIFYTSFETEKFLKYYINIIKKGVENITTDEVIEITKHRLEYSFDLEEKQNLPWLNVIDNTNLVQTVNENPDFEFYFIMKIEIVYSLLIRKLYASKESYIEITIYDLLNEFGVDFYPTEVDKQLFYMTLYYAVEKNKDITIKNSDIFNNLFHYNKTYKKIENFGSKVLQKLNNQDITQDLYIK